MPLISETLIAAKAIIEDRAAWTQYFHAINAAGESVRINEPDATCFCADAAIARAAGVKLDDDGLWIDTDHYNEVAEHMRAVACEVTGRRSYVAVNDDVISIPDMTPHEAILFLFDKGIERAKCDRRAHLEVATPNRLKGAEINPEGDAV
jgi:hypothetical protein